MTCARGSGAGLVGGVDPGLLYWLFQPATHDASAAMSQWTGGLVELELNEVVEIPIEEVAEELGMGPEPLAMVVLSLPYDVGGDLILAWDEAHGRALATRLLGPRASSTSPGDEWQVSALKETANILGCAYFNALARLIRRALVPSAPEFFRDFGASVLGHAVTNQAGAADQAIVFRTVFRRQGEALAWRVFFLPGTALREAMVEALHATNGRRPEGRTAGNEGIGSRNQPP